LVQKSNRYTVTIIVLSVLLAISLVVGTTFAWFASNDTASRTITLGDPVELNIVDQELNSSDSFKFAFIAGDLLVPGMKVNVFAKAQFKQSNTPALLRAKINVAVKDSTASPQDIADLQASLNASLQASVATSGNYKWVFNGGEDGDNWWYYLGTNPVVTEDITQSVMQRIYNNNEDKALRTITFIDGFFIFPTSVDNTFAHSKITFTFEVEGLQAILPAFDEPGSSSENEPIGSPFEGSRINKIANVSNIFNAAFAL
jgi:predicted ribosomally synthesized peptide with SipW-like signal peptide